MGCIVGTRTTPHQTVALARRRACFAARVQRVFKHAHDESPPGRAVCLSTPSPSHHGRAAPNFHQRRTLRARPCPSRAITYAHFLLLARRSRAAARRLRHDTSLVSSRRCCRSSVDHKSTVTRGSDQRMQKGQPRIRNSSVCCSRSVRARRRVVCLSGESLGFAGCPVQPKLPETPFPGSCFFFFLVVSSRPTNGDALMLP